MGYTTDFSGQIEISPPLNAAEIAYLTKFNRTRRMGCEQGPYYVDRGGDFGQGNDPKTLTYNGPPAGQPGLWCGWTVSEDGASIEWDGGEKFYHSAEWMTYIIDHFLKPGAIAKSDLGFLQANHVCSGMIEAQGEDNDDRWRLVVENNAVTTQQAVISWAA